MDIKVEIKEEPCFQHFNSENERDTKDLIKKAKIETKDSDINPELEEDSRCLQNEEHHLMVFNEAMEESEKIYIKEEHCWLKREDLYDPDDIKDGTQDPFSATNNPSLCKERVSGHTSDLSSTEELKNDESFNMNMDGPECGSDKACEGQESIVMGTSSIKTSICSETSDDGKIISMVSCLEQGKLLQQSHTNKQDINMENCNSILSHEYRQSYRSDVSKKCFKHSSNLEKCRLVLGTKKVNKCDVFKKDLNQLCLKIPKLTDEEAKFHKCNICNQSFTCLKRLKTHKLNHEGIKPHRCNTCNKAFADLSSLKRHKLVHEGIKPFKCNICTKGFTQLSNLKTHKLVHEGIMPHRCKICNKAFRNSSNLKIHNLIHEDMKPHKCKICNKAFRNSSNLKSHNLIHEDIKPHKCNICSKGFSHFSHFKSHKLIHEGIKPHMCNICNKTFTRLSNLKTHELIHDDTQSHKCNHCNKSFPVLSSLKRHRLIHEGTKPHKCDICNKAFTYLTSLKTHRLIHEGIKPHKCYVCNKNFTQVSHLKKHKLTHKDAVV